MKDGHMSPQQPTNPLHHNNKGGDGKKDPLSEALLTILDKLEDVFIATQNFAQEERAVVMANIQGIDQAVSNIAHITSIVIKKEKIKEATKSEIDDLTKPIEVDKNMLEQKDIDDMNRDLLSGSA